MRIAWHSIFSFVGAIVSLFLAVRLARPLVPDLQRLYAYATAVLVGGLITAHVGNIADNLPAYAAHPEGILPFWGGIAVTAAPIGSTVAGILAARRLRLPVGYMLDVASIAILVGLAVGRVGDVINGEHHAVACSGLPWCVRYTDPATLGQATYVHPVAVYDGLVDLALAALAYRYWRAVRGRPPEGRAYLLVLGIYGAARLATSFLRLDPVVVGPFQEAQLLGAAYTIVALPLLWLLSRRSRPAMPPTV